MPKVTFITVCFRTKDMVRMLLRGFEKAGLAFPYEYILVNNAPGDETSQMVRELFPWVKLIEAPGNIGYGAGNNLALAQAKGDYVMTVNPDIVVFPGQLEKLIAEADKRPEVGVFGPRLLNPDRTMQRSFYRFPTTLIPVYRRTPLGRTSRGKKMIAWYLMLEHDPTDVMEADWVLGGAQLIRKRMLDEVGAFDDRFFMYFEEVDLCRRAWIKGWRVAYVPQAELIHFHTRESDTGSVFGALFNRTTRVHIASAVKYFLKYRGKVLPR
ncbi:glycosyltransferase family 2 protein [Candidatus Uhrbacteria bacterium]|nr:glycosyltransferase family 2 protein [Candidatus Uhrbacteria bacterium]